MQTYDDFKEAAICEISRIYGIPYDKLIAPIPPISRDTIGYTAMSVVDDSLWHSQQRELVKNFAICLTGKKDGNKLGKRKRESYCKQKTVGKIIAAGQEIGTIDKVTISFRK